MKKKLMALLVIMTMVLSLTACKEKKNDVTLDSVIDEIVSSEIKQIEMEGTISASGVDYAGKVVVAQNSDDSAVIELKYKQNEAYTPVTTIYFNKDSIYINWNQAMSFLSSMGSQYTMLASYMKLDNDYIKITVNEILQYADSFGYDVSEFAELITDEKDNAVSESLQLEECLKLIKEISDESKTSACTLKDGAYDFTIDDSNANQLLQTIKSFDYAEGIKRINPEASDEYAADFAQNIKESLNGLPDMDFSDSKMNFNFNVKPETKEKENINNIFLSIKVEDETDKAVVNISGKTSSKASSDYSIPTEAVTLTEFMLKLQSLGLFE